MMRLLQSLRVCLVATVTLALGGCGEFTANPQGGGGGSTFPCTEQGIRDAIAAGGGPHTFDCRGQARVLTEAEVVIDNDVVLDGEGNLTLDANEGHRVFYVQRGVVASLHGFTITGGREGFGPKSVSHGGGILNHGMLTLTHSDVSANTIDWGSGGGIYNSGTLTAISTTVSDNAVFSPVSMGGGIANDGTFTLVNSTVSGNTSWFVEEEGCWASGIANGGTLTLVNSTVSGPPGPPCVIWNGGTFAATGSIIEGDCEGDVASDGYNIESPGNTCAFAEGTDLANVGTENLKLGPLADNGGPTQTHALLPGSLAIDVIPTAACEVDEDQRGQPRPGGTMCDVGSFEVHE